MVFIHVSLRDKEGEIILTEGQAFPLILFCQYAETLRKSSENDCMQKSEKALREPGY